ncbi:TIGR03545 family protein [Pseudidiomarina aestuarii]|uniref:TIGR03545 family protein n=1 Tax=Pseudidiomarina aestuarii TaxID=624146 RepID=A0A7Z6ZSC3_9GAMM|nr:TIGR03545 family protein [Pseudidiomarina aestuarii]
MRQSAIRWPGLAAFLIIVGLLVAFSWLLLDTIIKWSLERSLGTLNGAEVNIERVEHTWVPLGVRIERIQVTDPLTPTMNRVVIGAVEGTMNVEQLLLGRLHFENVVSTGIRVQQPRESEGEVYQVPNREDIEGWAKQGLAALNLEVPSTDKILERMELKTPAAISAAEEAFATQKERVNEARSQLPSEEKIKAYEAKVKALTESDIKTPQELVAKREEFAALKEEFEKDKKALLSFKETVTDAVEQLQTQFAAVKDAPAQDMARVRELMQLNSAGLTEITALLFGDQARVWSNYMLLAYEQLAPMLARSADAAAIKPQRGEGVWFSFTGANAPPDFLIKLADTEFAFGETILDVQWNNITHQHEQLGQPTTFRARADNTQLWSSFNLNGELALGAEGVDARQQWQLKGVKLDNLALSESAEFAANIVAALLDSEGSVALRDSALDGNATIRLADMQVTANAENRWAQVVASALQSLTRLDIQTSIAGSMTQPTFNLRSDLDRQLGSALKSAALQEVEPELASLRAKLQEQTGGFLGENEEELSELVGLLTTAENREARLQELLEAKIQNKLEDQVKDRLKGLLNGG